MRIDHKPKQSADDGQGRVNWQSDRYASATTYDKATGVVSEDNTTTANATFTIYDKSGNVAGTERHTNVSITIGDDPATNVSGVFTSTLGASGSKLSGTFMFYDGQGRVVETIDASGTRTGTVYGSSSQVLASGELKPEKLADGSVGVSDKGTSPWWTAPVPADDPYNQQPLTDYLDSLFVSYTRSTHLNRPDAVYFGSGTPVTQDDVTDALGHQTRTYQDNMGRPVETVYADGSYDATYYNSRDPYYAGQPVGQPDEWNSDPAVDGTWEMTRAGPGGRTRMTTTVQPCCRPATAKW